MAFFDFPAEHWIHLRTTDPIELEATQTATEAVTDPTTDALTASTQAANDAA